MYGDDNKRKGLKHHIHMLLRRIFPFLLFLLISCNDAPNTNTASPDSQNNLEQEQANSDINSVKNSINPNFKTLTVGNAIDNYKYFNNVEWLTSRTDNGIKLVHARCSVDLDSLVIDIYHYDHSTFESNTERKYAKDLLQSFTIQANFIINADDTIILNDIDFISCTKKGISNKKTLAPNDNLLWINLTNVVLGCIYENESLSNISIFMNDDFKDNTLLSPKNISNTVD